MTQEELIKRFPFLGKCGECTICTYVDSCDKILPMFTKPNKCGGPFYKKEQL